MLSWSCPKTVAFGGAAGTGPSPPSCPIVVKVEDRFYLFRTQRYGNDAVTSVCHSANPLDFGINDDAGQPVITVDRRAGGNRARGALVSRGAAAELEEGPDHAGHLEPAVARQMAAEFAPCPLRG
jgi:hypothetical protein